MKTECFWRPDGPGCGDADRDLLSTDFFTFFGELELIGDEDFNL
jgi:hypothetical protein